MANFYGIVQGNRGEATRMGSPKSGLQTVCASWNGAVRCSAFVGPDGQDMVNIVLEPWRGHGPTSRVLYSGPMNPDAGKEEVQ